MEISAYQTIITNTSLSGGKTMSHSGVNGVRRISSIESLTDRPSHERVVSGEILGKESASSLNESSNAGFTFDQSRDSHPGFYPKHENIGNQSQRAIDMYTDYAGVVSMSSNSKNQIVDLFV